MKSYTFGLLQTTAFKGLKGFTSTLLQPHQLTTYQWALIGILYETPEGLGTTHLAKELKVSKPFITKTLKTLSDSGWVEKSAAAETDMRSSKDILTPKAQKKVPLIEGELKSEMKKVLTGIPKIQLLAYILVLKHISKKLSDSVDDSAIEINSKT
jgi:DNA-binding MarR family transcriptional regulator